MTPDVECRDGVFYIDGVVSTLAAVQALAPLFVQAPSTEVRVSAVETSVADLDAIIVAVLS